MVALVLKDLQDPREILENEELLVHQEKLDIKDVKVILGH